MRGKLKRGRRKKESDVREMEPETEILNLRRQEAEEGKHPGKVWREEQNREDKDVIGRRGDKWRVKT